jgi:hypothetical protein
MIAAGRTAVGEGTGFKDVQFEVEVDGFRHLEQEIGKE